MESRQQVMYQAEYDIQKLLEMNNPPFAFIDTKLAELQSFVEEIGAAYSDVKIDWIQRLEVLKGRYETAKNGNNNQAAIERELIGLQFNIQTLMGAGCPKFEEIDCKMAEFRETMSKIPAGSEVSNKWKTMADILYGDYSRLKASNTKASTPCAQSGSDWGAPPTPAVKQHSNDWGAAPASQNQSNDWSAAPTTVSANQRQSDDWGAPPASVQQHSNDWGAPAPTPVNPKPQQSFDWSAAPAPTSQNQSNDWGAPPSNASASVSAVQQQSDDWGAPPASAQQHSNDWGAAPAPASQNQSNDWGAAPTSTPVNQQQSDDWGAPPASTQQQSNDWGATPGQVQQSSDWGQPAHGGQQQFNDWGSSADQGGNQGYGGNQAYGTGPSGDQRPQRNYDESPEKAAIREEMMSKINGGFARFNGVRDADDIKGLRILLQKTSKARRLLDAFRGHRHQMQVDIVMLGLSKLPEDLKTLIDSEQPDLNTFIQTISDKLKELSEAKAREPNEDELADLFSCTFCKVTGHNNNRCPVINSMLCSKCLQYGHTQKRCVAERLEPEDIIGMV